jgi:hypothetical protein
MLQNCSLINQFTTVSLQLHVGEFNLAKITTVKTITQYTKNTAAIRLYSDGLMMVEMTETC